MESETVEAEDLDEPKRGQRSLHLDGRAINILQKEHLRTKKSQSQIVNEAIYQMAKREELITAIVERVISESMAHLWGNAQNEIREAIAGQNGAIRKMLQEELAKIATELKKS